MFHAYAQGLSRYFCNRMRFWWPLHPFVVLFFSSHSCSVCANEGHCLLLGTMARLQTVATLATRPASARVNRRVWMNGACLVRFLFFPRCLRIFGLVQDPRPMFANCRRPWWRPMILRRIRPLLATMTLFFPPNHSSLNGNVLSNDFQWKRNVQRHLLPTARTCTFCVWFFLSIQQVQQLTSRDQCLGLQNLNIQTHDSFFNGRQMSMSGGMAVQVFQFQVNFAGFFLCFRREFRV